MIDYAYVITIGVMVDGVSQVRTDMDTISVPADFDRHSINQAAIRQAASNMGIEGELIGAPMSILCFDLKLNH